MIKKFKFLKKYEIRKRIINSDLWLLLVNRYRKNNFFFKYLYDPGREKLEYKIFKQFKNFFTLQISDTFKKKRKKFPTLYKRNMINKKLFFNFFYNISLYQLRKLSFFIKNKNLFHFHNFINILETRLDTILYRSNFFNDIRKIRDIIKKNYIFINKKIINKVYYNLKIGDYININNLLHYNIKKEFSYKLLKKQNIIYNSIYYLFINYKTLMIYLYTYPSITYICKKQIYYPKNLKLNNILNLNF